MANSPDLPLNADGSCANLNEQGLCSIYETRPDVCRIERMAEKSAAHLGLTDRGYLELTARICNQWQEEDGMPPEFRVALFP
jgi:Fe-S-cluster containining protein